MGSTRRWGVDEVEGLGGSGRKRGGGPSLGSGVTPCSLSPRPRSTTSPTRRWPSSGCWSWVSSRTSPTSEATGAAQGQRPPPWRGDTALAEPEPGGGRASSSPPPPRPGTLGRSRDGAGGATLDRGSPRVGGGTWGVQGAPRGHALASPPAPFPTDALKLPRTWRGFLGWGGPPSQRAWGAGGGRSPCPGLVLP